MKLDERKDIMRDYPLMKATVQRALLTALATDQTLREDVFRTCISCCNWNSDDEVCSKWKQRPPARVIANGCDDYEDIPF